jgi:transcriptional regulator with XRE-family HTH domain
MTDILAVMGPMTVLRQVRERSGLTQREFASQIDVAASLVCRVELGRIAPWPRFRRRAAEVLGVPERLLFDSMAPRAAPSLDPDRFSARTPARDFRDTSRSPER